MITKIISGGQTGADRAALDFSLKFYFPHGGWIPKGRCAGGLGDLPGTLAEYLVADANLIAHKPKTLTMREAAALPLVGITAYEGLTRAGIAEGQKVLVHGGAGGVGHVALQLARYFGAEVYATGSLH
jgi:NADPH:quinone reductase-like Zn-dependent oxidoreductase